MPARIINFSIEIPPWLDRLAVKAALLYRRLRYGYAFRRIPLTRGKYALVDPADHERLSEYKWHMVDARGTFYAVRNTGQQLGQKRIVVKMHREILKVPDGMFVDHINHNGLDNRRANLRPATQAQNARNRRKVHRDNYHSNYKGLTWYRREKRWAVRVMVDHKSKFIGYFDNELDAAKAYDQAAKEYHGDFASLNFPDVTANEHGRQKTENGRRKMDDGRIVITTNELGLRLATKHVLSAAEGTLRHEETFNSQ